MNGTCIQCRYFRSTDTGRVCADDRNGAKPFVMSDFLAAIASPCCEPASPPASYTAPNDTQAGSALPSDPAARKSVPLATGCLDYFPAALAAVAAVSKAGNDQHNAGQPLHWSRGKSGDHADCILRHQVDFDAKDKDGHYHAAKVAWRALAQLQELLEREEGAPLPRGARVST